MMIMVMNSCVGELKGGKNGYNQKSMVVVMVILVKTLKANVFVVAAVNLVVVVVVVVVVPRRSPALHRIMKMHRLDL